MKTATNENYLKQKKQGLSLVSFLLPTDSKQQLINQAEEEGIDLAAYIREKLLGKEYRQLKKWKKEP